jgi:hypothetical protein
MAGIKGGENNLIRRLKRHSQFGVLFRSHDPDSFAALQPLGNIPFATSLTGEEPDSERAVIAEISEMDSILEQQEELPLRLGEDKEGIRQQSVPQSQPTVSPTPVIRPVSQPAPVQRSPAIRTPSPHEKPTSSPPTVGVVSPPPSSPSTVPPTMPMEEKKEEKVTISDADWQRLSQIMRKHQEKGDLEETATGEGSEAPTPSEVLQRTTKSAGEGESQHDNQETGLKRQTESKKELPGKLEKTAQASSQIRVQKTAEPEPLAPDGKIQRMPLSEKIQEIETSSSASVQMKAESQQTAPPKLASAGADSLVIPSVERKLAEKVSEVKPQPNEPNQAQTIQASPDSLLNVIKNLPDQGLNPPFPETQVKTKSSPGIEVLKPTTGTRESKPSQAQEDHQQTERLPGQQIIQRESDQAVPQELSHSDRGQDVGAENLPEGEILNPLPLDEVWPIQKKTSQSVAQREFAEASAGAGEEPLPLVEEGHGEEVRQILSTVKPAQATDTTVEVITPRRVRPPVQTIQRKSQTEPSRQSSFEPRSSPSSEVKRQTADVNQAPVVPTKIGPLPADLWELIENPEPAGQFSSPTSERIPPGNIQAKLAETDGSISLESHEETEQRVMPAPLRQQTRQITPESVQLSSSKGPPEVSNFSQPSEEVIQEAEADDSSSSAGGDRASTGGPGQSGSADQANEQRIEELAHKVYSEIKRRLAVEWERARKIF